MRILHLIDPQSPDGGPCTMRLLADVMRRVDAQHDALVIGGRREIDLAVGCGVNVAGSISPPRALPWAGVNALREAAHAIERRRGAYDLVHAWTARSGALASIAFVSRQCVTTLHVGPGDGLESWHSLRTLRQRGRSALVASTAIRRQMRNRGFAADCVALLPSGVDARAAEIDRASIRNLLAERSEIAISDETFVVGLLGEPAPSADASIAATIAARVALSGRRIKLIVHPDANHRFTAQSMMNRLRFDDVILVDDLIAQPWKMVPALDAVLLVESRGARRSASSPLPLLWALSLGAPVVAEESESLRDVLEDGAGCMIVKQGEVNAAAERLTRLYDDRDLRRRLSEQGKSLAIDMFDIDAYAMRLRHSYDLMLANRTVRTTADALTLADVSAEAAIA